MRTIKYLFKEGLDINGKTKREGDTPAHYAAKNGHSEIVDLFEKLNADMSQNFLGKTPKD